MDRAAINSIGEALQTLRLDGEDVIVSVGAHAPSSDCRNGHVSATVRRGDDEGLGEAVSLDDALRLARGALRDAAKRREKAAEEAKAAKAGAA